MPTPTIKLDSEIHREFLNQKRNDPVTHEVFTAGNEVVVCKDCMMVHLKDVWTIIQECSGCGGDQLGSVLPGSNVGPKIIRFTASSNTFNGIDPVFLDWEVAQNPQKVLLNGEEVDFIGRKRVFPERFTQYILETTNFFGKDSKMVEVDNAVLSPAITYFTCSQNYYDGTQEIILTWEVKNADRVYIEPDIGIVFASGDQTVVPTKDTTYQIRAYNINSEMVESSLTIIVDKTPPKIHSFTASHYSLEEKKPVMIHWMVERAKSVKIQPYLGEVNAYGEKEIAVNRNTEFILTATSLFGVEQIQRIEVFVADKAPEISYFFAAPNIVIEGQQTTLWWKVTDNIGNCEVQILPIPGAVELSGNHPFLPENRASYRLETKNYFGNYSYGYVNIDVIKKQQLEFDINKSFYTESRIQIPKANFPVFRTFSKVSIAEKNFSIPKNKLFNSPLKQFNYERKF